ncbi:MAG: Mrp/NBP35 family ATP-binding protein [Bacteroidia bacterium]|nr:Mrp/NBP35 family ATP-binding protein [Bacteroidia bacterium]
MHKIEKVTLPNVKHIIAIASGKGGVGKSTVAANLALTFAQSGYKTALVDADLYSPSIPILFGLENQHLLIEQRGEKHVMIPFEKNKIKLMSVGFLVNPEQALIWRGPMASSALLQLFSETDWGEIDYMVVDLPPGTGDIPLTLCQQVDIDGVIIVTTPQKLSFADVQKAITMFKNPDINKPVLGIVENMSWFTPLEHPDEKYFLFGKGGGQYLAKKFNSELLLQIPLIQDLCDASDRGFLSDFSKRPEILSIYNELIRKISSKFN